MALILALDTATEACSAAVLDTGTGQSRQVFEVIPRQHSQRLMPMIDEVLAASGQSRSQIDAVAFGRGPGAFTGVRIATGIAQGLGWALDRPVVPVSTLAALAQQALRVNKAERVLAAIDARMDEVYWAAYQAKGELMLPVQEEQVCAPELAGEAVPEGWVEPVGIGTGWLYRSRINVSLSSCTEQAYPQAEDIARLAAPVLAAGDALPAEQALPVYLRDNVALKKSERQQKG